MSTHQRMFHRTRQRGDNVAAHPSSAELNVILRRIVEAARDNPRRNRDRGYDDTGEYPNASELSGLLTTYAVFASVELGETHSRVRLGIEPERGRREQLQGSTKVTLPPVPPSKRSNWNRRERSTKCSSCEITPSASAFGGLNWTEYEPLAAIVDAEKDREDFEWRAGARLELSVADHAGIGVQVQFWSTLPPSPATTKMICRRRSG
jgi:hypothetical protein